METKQAIFVARKVFFKWCKFEPVLYDFFLEQNSFAQSVSASKILGKNKEATDDM